MAVGWLSLVVENQLQRGGTVLAVLGPARGFGRVSRVLSTYSSGYVEHAYVGTWPTQISSAFGLLKITPEELEERAKRYMKEHPQDHDHIGPPPPLGPVRDPDGSICHRSTHTSSPLNA
jgi:hypothetical protein